MNLQERKDIEMVKNDNPIHSDFPLLPMERRTEKVSLEAVKSNPLNLEYVPSMNMTPEMCLTAVKADPSLKRHVPEAIKSAKNNLYTFCFAMEENYHLNLSVKDAKDLYAGKPLKVDRVKANGGELSSQMMQYDPIGMNMTVKPCKQWDHAQKKKKSGLRM